MKRLLLASVCLLPLAGHAQSVYPYTGRTSAPAVAGDPLQLSERKAADAAKCDLNASACLVAAINGAISQTMAAKLGEVLSTADMAVPATGDAQPALQAAVNAIGALGGGSLRLLARQYPLIAADLEVPPDVHLLCDGSHGGLRPTLNYTAVPCALVPAVGRTVRMDDRSALTDVPVIYGGLAAAPTDMRSGINYINSFAGIGITVQGNDVRIDRGFVLGFGLCVSNVGYARLHATELQGDCRSGVKNDQNHDVVRLDKAEFWPFGLVAVSWGFVPFAVSGSANNGSGLVRLTLSSAMAAPYVLITGDVINLSQAMGLPRAMRKRWTVTVVDATHIDLQGSTYPTANAFMATTVAGSNGMWITDNSGLGVGMAVNGSYFPAGTTITGIYEGRIEASAPASASGSNVTLSASGVSGTATAYIDLTARTGIGFEFTNGERNECRSCFDFGYTTGLHIGTGAGWTYAPGYASDHEETEDGDTVGISITDSAYDSIIEGPWISGHAVTLRVSSQAGPAHKIANASFNVGSTLSSIQLLSGDTTVTASTLAPEATFGAGAAYVSSAIHSVIWGNDNIGTAPILFPINTPPVGFTAGNIYGANPP